MTVLEDRYRRVLRLLPAPYRQVWEDEMVATFLAGRAADVDPDADDPDFQFDFGRPGLGEVASVLSLATRLRLGGAGAAPRSFAWGETVRTVALVGLLTSAVRAGSDVLLELWLGGTIPWPGVPGVLRSWADPAPTVAGFDLLARTGLWWPVAFLALVIGWRRVAQAVAAAAFLLPLASTAVHLATRPPGGPPVTTSPLSWWTELVVGGLLLLALGAFHREAPAVRPRPWLVAFGAGLVVLTAATGLVLYEQVVSDRLLIDGLGILAPVAAVAGLVRLAAPVLGHPHRAPHWSTALAILGTAVLAMRVVSLAELAATDPGWATPALTVAGLLQVAAVLAVTVPLGRQGARELRLLAPDLQPGPSRSPARRA